MAANFVESCLRAFSRLDPELDPGKEASRGPPAEAENEATRFLIPLNDGAAPLALVSGLCHRLLGTLPDGSWPQTLVREAFCALSQQSKYLGPALAEVRQSAGVGPVGHWAFAEVLGYVELEPMRRSFARAGLDACTLDGFRKDLRLVTGAPAGRAWLRALGETLREDAERTGEPGAMPSAREKLLREARSFDPEAAAMKLFEDLWSTSIERLLRERLTALASEDA